MDASPGKTTERTASAPPSLNEPRGIRDRVASFFRWAPTRPFDALSYDDRRGAMLRVTIAWCFGTIFSEGVTGAPIVGMFLMLGATPAWIGLLVALPSLASMLQPFGSYLVDRTQSRKRLFFRLSFPGRLGWIAIVALGAVLPPGLPTIALLFALIFAVRVLTSMAHPPWFSWMSDIPPRDRIGAFWSNRQMAGRVSSIFGLMALNSYLGTDPTYRQFAVFFTTITLLGLVDLLIHRSVVGIEMAHPPERPTLRAMYLDPWKDPKYRPLLVFVLVFAFANQIGSGMISPMLLNELHLSYFEISLYFPGMTGALWVLSSKPWGRLVDNLREGERLIYIVCATISAVHVLIWPMIGPRQHWLIAIVTALSGISMSGYHIALTALIIGYSPPGGRATYVAAYSLVFGLGNMLGAILGGQIAERLAGLAIEWGPFHLTQFRTLYLISGVARIACLALLFRIGEPGAVPIGVYVRQVLALNPFDAGTWVYIRSKFRAPGGRD